MRLREAVENDLVGLIELYRQLNPDDEKITDENKLYSTWNRILINNSIMKVFVIESDEGSIISSCVLAIIPNLTRGMRPFSIIENVITHKDYRNKGYGSQIISKAIEHSKENNCYKIMLLSSTKLKEAHKFYEKMGFNSKDKIGFNKYL